MAERGDLERAPALAVKIDDSTSRSLAINWTISDMTPEAANAAIEASRNTYAVPAEEETKRSLEETKRSNHINARLLIALAASMSVPALAWSLGVGGDGLVRVFLAAIGVAAVERTITSVFGPRKKPAKPTE